METEMFEVGKQYKRWDDIVTCLFVYENKSINTIRHQAVLLFEDGSAGSFNWKDEGNDMWEEYTPPPKMVKVTKWANIYKTSAASKERNIGVLFDDEGEAKEITADSRRYIATVPVTWE